MKDKDLEKLKKITEKSADGLNQSEINLTLYGANFKDDPVAMIQLGLSVVMDKPIAVIVPLGVEVPDNLKRLAYAIEYCDTEDKNHLLIATKRIKKAMEEFLI